MDDLVDPLEGAFHGIAIPHVAGMHLDIGVQAIGAAIGVNLLDEAVEDPHMITTVEQRACHIAPDEAGATGDQDRFRQAFILRPAIAAETCGAEWACYRLRTSRRFRMALSVFTPTFP
jgi:hypothetical protein